MALGTLCLDVLAKIVLMLEGRRLASSLAALLGWSAHPDTNDLLNRLLLLHLPTGLLAWVAFMLWMLQARLNAQSLTRVPHRWFKTFILMGWIIPIANCWIPKQIVDDIWASSRPGGVPGENIGRETHSGLVWAWWISWLLASGMTGLSLGLLVAPDHRTPVASILVDALFLLPVLVAAVLQVAVIMRITRFQQDRLALHRPMRRR